MKLCKQPNFGQLLSSRSVGRVVGGKIGERMWGRVVWMGVGKKFNGIKCSKLNKVEEWEWLMCVLWWCVCKLEE